jgi:cyanamide hydratase
MSNTVKISGLSQNGWAAVPRSFKHSLAEVDKNKHAKLSVAAVKLPDSEIAKKTYDFAKRKLPEKTFYHSMRVWYYGK